MKQISKLTGNQQEEIASETQSNKTEARQFNTVEELLRHDARQTVVPGQIARRLEKSLGECPPSPPRRPWWRRLLG